MHLRYNIIIYSVAGAVPKSFTGSFDLFMYCEFESGHDRSRPRHLWIHQLYELAELGNQIDFSSLANLITDYIIP